MALNTQGQYRLVGNKITYEVAPQPGDIHEAIYFRGKKVIDGPPSSITLSLLTSYQRSPDFQPALFSQYGTGLDPDDAAWLGFSWGVTLGDIYSFSFAHSDASFEHQLKTVDVSSVPLATLAVMQVAASMMHSLAAPTEGALNMWSIEDCYLTFTYPSGGSIATRPTVFQHNNGAAPSGGVSHPGGFTMVIYREQFGLTDAPYSVMGGFPVPS